MEFLLELTEQCHGLSQEFLFHPFVFLLSQRRERTHRQKDDNYAFCEYFHIILMITQVARDILTTL